MRTRNFVVAVGITLLALVSATATVAAGPSPPPREAKAPPLELRARPLSAPLAGTECEIGGDNAHKSTHEPTTVNVIVYVKCTNSIPAISIRAGLYYWTGTKWELNCCNAKSGLGTSEESENYASTCKVGWWQGYLWYHLIYINEEERQSEGSVGKEAYIEKC